MTKRSSVVAVVVVAIVLGAGIAGWRLSSRDEPAGRHATGARAAQPVPSESLHPLPQYPQVPTEVFLSTAEARSRFSSHATAGYVMPPNLCDIYYYGSSGGAISFGGRSSERKKSIGWDHKDLGRMVQSIGLYRGDGAEQFLREYRDFAASCPRLSDGVPPRDDNLRNQVLEPLPFGDETFIVRRSRDAPPERGEQKRRRYEQVIVTIRVKDAVTVILMERPSQAEVTRLTRLAADHLRVWRRD